MNATVFRLLAVLREGPRDASGILDRLRELSDDEPLPSLAGFYRGLKRAVDEDWIEVVEGEAEGNRGRPPQGYIITPGGRAAAETEALRMKRLAGLVLTTPHGGSQSGK